jgi:hypothetical protein
MTKSLIETMLESVKLGIVGSEAAKFTPRTEGLARLVIHDLIQKYNPDIIISGGCHLGGIDKWAIEGAEIAEIGFIEYLPKTRNWEGGYKERNLRIARNSDIVVCITVKELPSNYTGMRFKMCYHCKTDTHVKSGGCWTVKEAKKLGKRTEVIVI